LTNISLFFTTSVDEFIRDSDAPADVVGAELLLFAFSCPSDITLLLFGSVRENEKMKSI